MVELVAPEFRPEFDTYLKQIQRTGEAQGILALITRSGERRIWEYHNTLRTDGVSSPVVRGMAHDVTEQKQSQRALRLSEERLRIIFEKSPVGVCVVESKSGQFLKVNPRFCEFAGRTEDDLLRRNVQSVTHPDDLEDSVEKMRQLADGEIQHFEIEKRFLRSCGAIRWGKISVVRTSDEEKYRACNIAVIQDITERKLAEAALRGSEAHLRSLIEQASDGIFVSDGRGRYLDVNTAGAAMLGYTAKEILGLTIADVVAADEIPRIEPEIARLSGGNVIRADWRFRRKDGSFFPGEVAVRQLTDGRLQAILRDVTERKRAEHAVAVIVRQVHGRSSEAFFSSMAYHLAECLSASHTIIGECVGGRTAAIKTIGVCSEGQLVENFIYKLTDTPSAEVLNQGLCCYPSDVEKIFPNDTWMIERKVEGYIGIILHDSRGKAIGVMAALYKRPIDNRALAEMILKLFSARTGVEIERKHMEDALVQNEARLCEINQELERSKEKLTEEKLYFEHEIDTEMGFGEIIGKDHGLKRVLEQVYKVASSDTTALLLGETGTGKELIARALHRMSKRKDNAFIKVNCAAIPSNLLESELFGHERGSFTGALARKIGRIELADKGTLFLDEIGEIPLELQPKLLRVLQDQEFERLGSNQTLKVNFRLIAATNRDLFRDVQENRFRSDLYYRLNVFPVRTPPLRERRNDVPMLVEHFVHKYAKRMNKEITSIPKKTMDELVHWTWPGNVRELENFVERSVILTNGTVLEAPISELASEEIGSPEALELVQRKHILQVLEETAGRLSGPGGAAARLGLPRTTLQSKLKQMGINYR